ncbi:hypothetical protein [Bacillus sp. UNC41MFS5]|uniref:hypothetical protein n=1 Tax=Bacillus sp. UNC41MFS5 TaxID=1449046 RepID=UPI0012DED273|nr:hypothetical protein [Bacillus sp. UNC41MFS5]
MNREQLLLQLAFNMMLKHGFSYQKALLVATMSLDYMEEHYKPKTNVDYKHLLHNPLKD